MPRNTIQHVNIDDEVISTNTHDFLICKWVTISESTERKLGQICLHVDYPFCYSRGYFSEYTMKNLELKKFRLNSTNFDQSLSFSTKLAKNSQTSLFQPHILVINLWIELWRTKHDTFSLSSVDEVGLSDCLAKLSLWRVWFFIVQFITENGAKSWFYELEGLCHSLWQ